jgi:hypothetical protein
MAKVQVHIWYDSNGRIAAIGQPAPHCKAIPIASRNLHTLIADVDQALVAQLHQTHSVDIEKASVIPRRIE